ncbi:unnamed protein product [Ilex paraguariensis]|uniref:Disease resistance protein RPS4B/Roq1-like leucine-rich repeats domain-containing protein n=1 Tax=Ilex paraguariensis TaxID=185542 RepID=A0ABC8U8Y4_9AQUA
MHRLRLLQLDYVHFNDNGRDEEFPKKLRLLCWHGFHLKYIPSSFPLETLVALDMRYSSLEQVWKKTRFLPLLKSLDLSHSHSLAKTPDFSALPNLERLILKGCTSIVEVHESIGNLKRLVFLNLKGCKNLRTLPRKLFVMKFLETLIISGCSNLKRFPAELRKMESLEVLHADGIAINRLLPSPGKVGSKHTFGLSSKWRKGPEISWASLPTSLVSLSLADCSLSDEDFPPEFSNLSSLQHLNLSKNPIFSQPNCIRDLTRLQTLQFESCMRLQLLEGLPSVKKLNVSNCMSLEKITFLSTMFRLREAAFDGCRNLVEVQGWFKLEPFERIDPRIINFLGLHDFKAMANLKVILANGLLGVFYSKICPIQVLSLSLSLSVSHTHTHTVKFYSYALTHEHPTPPTRTHTHMEIHATLRKDSHTHTPSVMHLHTNNHVHLKKLVI